VNGIGERAGNASLEEIVMLLRTRRAKYAVDTGIASREIARTSRLVSRLTGYVVPPNKAIVGKNAFAHEAGIHQDGVLKHRRTYEIMDAESVGIARPELVLGKHSGRHALQNAFRELGYDITGEELRAAFERFKEIADRKKHVTALDLEALADDRTREHEGDERLVLERLAIRTTTGEAAWATVQIRDAGEARAGEAEGDGPIDAVFRAIEAAVGSDVALAEYGVSAVTGGPDALGDVRVVVQRGDRSFAAQAVSTDIAEASALAYIRAVSLARLTPDDVRSEPLETI
jgi:2-isopropylmalate synthase